MEESLRLFSDMRRGLMDEGFATLRCCHMPGPRCCACCLPEYRCADQRPAHHLCQLSSIVRLHSTFNTGGWPGNVEQSALE